VLNDTDIGVEEGEWDCDQAKENLMSMVQDAIRLVPEFKAYVELWQRLGRRIRTVDDLFLCYYSSLTVIRVPDKDHLMRMNSQVNKLHDQITQRCQEGFTAKVKARMSSNADELQSYLSAGFEHFATKLDRPFNFIDIALQNNPIPQDFDAAASRSSGV
jgi:hypothetical protein